MAVARPIVSNNMHLMLDGCDAGFIQECSLPLAEAQVIKEIASNSNYQFKHLSSHSFKDLTFKCGAAMTKGFYDWVKQSFDNNYAYKNGSLVTADYNYKEVSRCDFFNALIKELTLPALDAGSKDPALMSLTVAVEKSKYTNKPGASIANGAP